VKRSLGILLLCAGLLPAQSLLIQNATVIDGTGSPPRQTDVLISNGRIVAVGLNLPAPNSTRLDARGKTLLPGLFDLHTHVQSATVSGSGQDWGKNLKAYLLSGVTTVADFGTYGETFATVRKLTASGAWPAPRLHLASRVTTPGGHGLEIGRGEIFTQEVLTAREGRAAVRRALPYRPDVIKVFSDGWRYGSSADLTSMEEGTLRAIVEEAHKANLPVLTHTVTVDKGKIAAAAGVDAIMHGMQDKPFDAELIAKMKAGNTAYGPTSAVYEPRTPVLDALLEKVLDTLSLQAFKGRPAFAQPSALRIRKYEVLKANTKSLFDAGIPIVAGTDAGISGTHHGWATLREITLLHSAGLPPVEAIKAATLNSARVLRVDKDRGSIEPGKAADLVLIDGAPHTNIQDIQKVHRVWLNGVEQDLAKLAAAVAAPGPTPLPAIKAPVLLDDFNRVDGRSRLDTRWINTYEGGPDLSRALFQRTGRAPGNFSLAIQAQMSESSKPRVHMTLPLRPGGIEPMDFTGWKALEFEARGDSLAYQVILSRRSKSEPLTSSFTPGPAWKKFRIPFTELDCPCADATALTFVISRPAGVRTWLELDNIKLVR
jgi:imidazolonepropionase-like amidohydrolase